MADWKSSSAYFTVCNFHRAPGRERHQVAQVVVGADQVADDVDLGGDAAEELGMSRATIYRKVAQYDIHIPKG